MWRRTSIKEKLWFFGCASCVLVGLIGGCFILPHPTVSYVLHGRFLDGDTMLGLEGVGYGFTVLKDGEEIAVRMPRPWNTPGSEGVFSSSALVGPPLVRVDQVEVTVIRGACEQQFRIDLDEEDRLTTNLLGNTLTIELADPIVVGPCQE